MPENLRSKEKEALSKSKDYDFDFDLVIPEEKKIEVPKKEKKKSSGSSFWSKLFKKKKKHKPKESILSREIRRNGNGKKKEEKKPEEKIEIPKKEEEKKPSVESRKLMFFNRKKKHKLKESILSREIRRNGNGKKKEEKKPEEKIEIPKKEEKKPEFIIPKEEKKKEKKPEEKIEIPKFHKPEPRVRAKFLEASGVDLIPTAAKTKSWKQIINLLITSLIVSVSIVLIFFVVLFLQEKNIHKQQTRKAEQITGIEREIQEFKTINDEINVLGKDIYLINNLLNKHLYWTNFFELLEKYTVAEVHYKGLIAGNNGSMTLEAVGNSFDSVARQLKVLQSEDAKEFVSSVNISSASLSEDGVSFSINLILNTNLFYYSNQD